MMYTKNHCGVEYAEKGFRDSFVGLGNEIRGISQAIQSQGYP